MNLVPNWKSFWKYYSNIFHTMQLAAVIGWNQLPHEWKDAVPQSVLFTVAGTIWVSGIVGSIVNQDKGNTNG